jgi:hypothetical protein
MNKTFKGGQKNMGQPNFKHVFISTYALSVKVVTCPSHYVRCCVGDILLKWGVIMPEDPAVMVRYFLPIGPVSIEIIETRRAFF